MVRIKKLRSQLLKRELKGQVMGAKLSGECGCFPKGREGFTLIELLVVISVIALLLSILMPSLRKVKEQTRMVTCQSNLKHWSVIFLLYAVDNNESFPVGYCPEIPGGSLGNGHRWMATMEPYYEDKKICFCPAATKQMFNLDGTLASGNIRTGAWGYFPNGETGSYGLNEWVSNPPLWIDMIGGRHNSRNFWRKTLVSQPDTIPLFLDSWWPGGFPNYLDMPPEQETDETFFFTNLDILSGVNEMNKHCIDRHENAKVNGVFIDSSVRKIGLKGLWNLKWHRNFDTDIEPVWPEWMEFIKD